MDSNTGGFLVAARKIVQKRANFVAHLQGRLTKLLLKVATDFIVQIKVPGLPLIVEGGGGHVLHGNADATGLHPVANLLGHVNQGRTRVATGAAWLDRLWIIENLMSRPDIRDQYPQLAVMREKERYMAWRSAVRGMLGMVERSAPPKPWIRYFGYRIRRLITGVGISGRI